MQMSASSSLTDPESTLETPASDEVIVVDLNTLGDTFLANSRHKTANFVKINARANHFLLTFYPAVL